MDPNIKPERLYTAPVKKGTPMHARSVCRVLASKDPAHKEGALVSANPGWVEYGIYPAKMAQPAPPLPNGLGPSHYLGAFGLTGLTAYYGLTEIAGAQSSDVVVISGAAGATGSMAVQIAKHMLGCKTVVGIAGSDAKCRWVEGLGADVCLNYKSASFKDDLVKATPEDASVYFDNVGGEILDLMIARMARYGRIAVCGSISNYNGEEKLKLANWFDVISMRIKLQGFIILDGQQKWAGYLDILKKALAEGKIKVSAESEQIVDTKFEDIPKTWTKLFEGANTGKLVTKIV